MSILVTGGAGYIGSHMVLALADAGEQVVVLVGLNRIGRPDERLPLDYQRGSVGRVQITRFWLGTAAILSVGA